MLLKTNSNYSHIRKEKEELIPSITSSLRNYLTSNAYPPEIISEIVNEDFISSNPSYYLYYPYLFKDYFEIEDTKVLDLLSISGFLYYKAIILIDKIFDDKKSKNNFQKYFIANICQEETIKILSSFFPVNSSFWKTWSLRKFEYAKAYKLDKTLKSINNFSEFEALADYKSAFGKIAIDCLYHLSETKNKPLYTALLTSHKYFYVAFQIMDDIQDYSEDIENEQFNISKHELIQTLHSENETIEAYSLVDQKKLMYLKGIAENLYEKATIYLDKSLKLQTSFNNQNSQFWTNEIDGLYNTGVTHFLNIKGFISVYTSQKTKSQELKTQSNLKETIEDAITYLQKSQATDGSWIDILNDAGVSDVWTTCFVTYSLNELKTNVPNSIVDNAKNYIKNHQLPCKLWSYNKVWLEDADSSSFALLSLKDEKDNLKNALQEWFKFQKNDGGFTTYTDKNILVSSLNSPTILNVDGWLQSHFCVSAVAFVVCIELEITQKEEFTKLKDYLVNNLKSDHKTLSYWWTNDAYALYFILLGAVKMNDTELMHLCEKRLESILNHEKELNYYYKGFLLKSLCLTTILFVKHASKIEKLVLQLVSNQYTDGSWQESHSLKMPHPSVINADNEAIHWKEGTKGTNIIVKDFNRVFTTVSCLSALKTYEARIS